MRAPWHLEVKRLANDYAVWVDFGRKHGAVMFGQVAVKALLECATAVARVKRRNLCENSFSPYWPE